MIWQFFGKKVALFVVGFDKDSGVHVQKYS